MNQSIAPRRHSSTGFTLVEMIIVCTIVGILLSIGLPSYRFVTTANRVSSEVNGLLGDLQFARAEAIKQGIAVSICPTADQATCLATGNAWQTGWLVFTDLNTPPNGVINTAAGDQLLRAQRSFTNTDTLTVDNAIKYLSFNRNGFMMNAATGVTFSLHNSSANTAYTRCLSGTLVGALATQRYGQTTAEAVACN